MGYVGTSGTLHDGRTGVRLLCSENCEAGEGCTCYELAIEDAVGDTPEEKADDLTQKAQGDGLPLTATAAADGVITFTYGQA